MSKRAYSRFVVGSRVCRAVQEGAWLDGFQMLFFKTCINGSPTPYLIALLCIRCLVPPEQCMRLRDKLFLSKAGSLQMPAPGK